MTDLPDALREAAATLGRRLGESEFVQAYREAQARLEADPEVLALDRRFQTLYQYLLALQQAGEELPQDEVNEFLALRRQMSDHPLVAAREFALRQLKGYFADVALELGVQLGVDFTALAGAA